ncbi:MAG: polysaccharide deacetylase family protein [Oligoflexia bacterium]|nr:polysaccharide deacetylase family protein [Oligoflexia bacterium]MBF0365701.1 polysaccharide deacetylase family protein [Oligoflexia bacterium]
MGNNKKRIIQKATLAISRLLFPLVLYLSKNKMIPILMFHQVLPRKEAKKLWTVVELEHFQEICLWIKKYFYVLTPSEFEAETQVGQKKPPLLITFDDGWEDNYHYAFPVLKEFKLPAVIFLNSKFVAEGGIPWPEELYLLHLHHWEKIKGMVLSYLASWQLEVLSLEDWNSNYLLLLGALKRMGLNARESVLREIKSQLLQDEMLVTSPVFKMLSLLQIEEMQQSGLIFFGLHTHSHQIISTLSQAQLDREISENKNFFDINHIPGAHWMAYPNGQEKDYTLKNVKHLSEVFAIKYAFSTKQLFYVRGRSLLEIPRIGVAHGTTTAQLKWPLLKAFIKTVLSKYR